MGWHRIWFNPSQCLDRCIYLEKLEDVGENDPDEYFCMHPDIRSIVASKSTKRCPLRETPTSRVTRWIKKRGIKQPRSFQEQFMDLVELRHVDSPDMSASESPSWSTSLSPSQGP